MYLRGILRMKYVGLSLRHPFADPIPAPTLSTFVKMLSRA
jgi:hypothetical protein